MIVPARVAAKMLKAGISRVIACCGVGEKAKRTGMTALPFTNDRLPLNGGDTLSSAWKRNGRYDDSETVVLRHVRVN